MEQKSTARIKRRKPSSTPSRRQNLRNLKKKRSDVRVKKEPVELEDLGAELSVDRPAVREALLDWYAHHYRVLPWRQSPGSHKAKETTDEAFAYAVWVSEVMLQQTQVVKVIEYFERWIQKWPSVQDLAQASLDDVREMWSGLGYYSRAANLLKGAQFIVENLDGRFPSSIKELQQIPGVGPYTSRAIASIAFQVPEAVVDGNVIRVLSRIFAVPGDPKKQQRRFQILADSLLDRQHPGDFNQAVMEFGAMLCRPTNPRCQECPVQLHCRAYQNSLHAVKSEEEAAVSVPQVPSASMRQEALSKSVVEVTDYPMLAKKSAKKEMAVAVCVLQFVSNGRVWYLMLKRPKTGLLAGLWEFPTVHLPETTLERHQKEEEHMNAFLRNVFEVNITQLAVIQRASIGSVVHIFSHIRMTLHIEALQLRADPHDICISSTVEFKWVPREEIDSIGMCTMVKKVYNVFHEYQGDKEQKKQFM